MFHLRIDPAGHGVTEEDELRENTSRVDLDHLTHASEGRVLLVIVPDVPQRSAPGPHKLDHRWRHHLGTHQPHPAQGDRGVLKQRLRGVLPTKRELEAP